MVLVKGPRDILARPGTAVVGTTRGCLRRCGGQGDVLSGAIASMLAIQQLHRQLPSGSTVKNQEALQERRPDTSFYTDDGNSDESTAVLLASVITREAAHTAEVRCSGYISATDILNELGPVFRNLGSES